MTKDIGLDTAVSQTIGLVAADMDGEKVMLNIETGKYYGLDSTGSRIWELIARPQTAREVVQTLLADYDVNESACQKDVVIFLNKLCDQGLIDIV